jgi:RNA polymerase sigma factor (sigma-70 family)
VPEATSITTWLGELRQGNSQAAQHLWERYFARLVAFARSRLRGSARQAADEEDVALSAFHSFCRAAERFPRLNNRDDLWQVLVMVTARKVGKERRRQQSLRRGGGVEQECRSARQAFDVGELEQIIGNEPDPQFAVMLAEHFEALLSALPSVELREVARLRLEEYSTQEIARELRCTERTVRRRLILIRTLWETSSP